MPSVFKRAAAVLLGLSERQVWRLLKAYRLRGADGLISKKRGQPSNRKTPDNVRSAVMAIVKKRYADLVRRWQPRSCESSTT